MQSMPDMYGARLAGIAGLYWLFIQTRIVTRVASQRWTKIIMHHLESRQYVLAHFSSDGKAQRYHGT